MMAKCYEMLINWYVVLPGEKVSSTTSIRYYKNPVQASQFISLQKNHLPSRTWQISKRTNIMLFTIPLPCYWIIHWPGYARCTNKLIDPIMMQQRCTVARSMEKWMVLQHCWICRKIFNISMQDDLCYRRYHLQLIASCWRPHSL